LIRDKWLEGWKAMRPESRETRKVKYLKLLEASELSSLIAAIIPKM
jgi:hypothetical protein